MVYKEIIERTVTTETTNELLRKPDLARLKEEHNGSNRNYRCKQSGSHPS